MFSQLELNNVMNVKTCYVSHATSVWVVVEDVQAFNKHKMLLNVGIWCCCMHMDSDVVC